MQKFAETLTYKNSRGVLAVAPGAQLSVFEEGTAVLASTYADDEATPLDNPLTADERGLVQFKLPNGTYDFVYSNSVGEVKVDGIIASDGTGGGGGQEVSSEVDTVVVCDTSMPCDDTVPQNTEGTEVATKAITPANASSVLEITYLLTGSATGTMFLGAAVFKDSDASALVGSVSMEQLTGANQKAQMSWTFRVAAGNTSARTYKLRAGPHNDQTFYVNGDSAGARLLGGNAKAQIIIREVLPA
jgi:hypothetical protein